MTTERIEATLEGACEAAKRQPAALRTFDSALSRNRIHQQAGAEPGVVNLGNLRTCGYAR